LGGEGGGAQVIGEGAQEAQDEEAWDGAEDGVEDEVVCEDGYTQGMFLLAYEIKSACVLPPHIFTTRNHHRSNPAHQIARVLMLPTTQTKQTKGK
jgi:hypothetical protein